MFRRKENLQAVAVLLAAALCFVPIPAAAAEQLATAAEERVGNEVSGSIITPGVGTTVIKMVTADGVELQAFPEMSGAFTFRDVPPGSHMLQAFCIGYYFPELRKPVDIWSILKSPYGLMMVFSVFIIFVMPKLKVDPEEYKEMQAQLKGGSNGGAASGGQKAIAGR
ncbi:hypothetical protein DUNSADRAFT_5039 [Dunaliella salina]|uniref:ER membrane protein complex subunit 7 beta-sandwich domain-containing protein n=1 Tax=Dunaliella salina TaxID=3046 RepID=A0ABQ7HAC0_DUNSA|nr:hypothetical protein DUNSADRAFT_5039 [Dunaliella salina]|eukprot:KAF5843802.1 hypothetical protein DUNSADRAFT_5039 [Dunaliella salina]